MNVKTVVGLKCQNGAGMSKLCRYILSKWCRCRHSFGHKSSSIHTYFKCNCNRTNECSGRSKQSEFTRLASILRYVTIVGIFMSIMSYFDINHTLRSIFGEEFSMNLSRLLGCERINVYSGQSKQSEFTHDLCHLFGMHQGRCCHEPILALLDYTLATLNNQRSICSL